MSLLRKLLVDNTPKDYIKFADPAVEKICAENWGDGTGITYAQAARVKTLGNKFQGNTEITSFDELQYFYNLRRLNTYEFQNCTSLQSIDARNIEIVGNYSFNNTAIINYQSDMTNSIGEAAFNKCQQLRMVYVPQFKPQLTSGTRFIFAECTSLEKFTFSDEATNIAAYMFDQDTKLDVDNILSFFKEKCVNIGKGAFRNTLLNIDELKIPNLIRLENNAFQYTNVNYR